MVYFGSIITIKSTLENTFLHSHNHKIPIAHLDGRISSNSQQVTGYTVPTDENNNWLIVPPLPEDADNVWDPLVDTRNPVKNGQIVRLKHVSTGMFLISHDVASPLTTTNQEVAAAKADSISDKYYSKSLWKVDIKKSEVLTSRLCTFRLIHVETNCSLFNFQKNLPDWGFNQREINSVRNENQPTLWVVHKVIPPTRNYFDFLRCFHLIYSFS